MGGCLVVFRVVDLVVVVLFVVVVFTVVVVVLNRNMYFSKQKIISNIMNHRLVNDNFQACLTVLNADP